MAPPGLASGIVSSFVKASPEVLFLAFGRKAILGSATMWQALLYPAIFTWFLDMSLRFLFGWQTKNITPHQKLAAYPHLYSFTSTKSVVHWFQIIRNGTFQMYDDEVQAPLSITNGAKYYKVAKFPTRNIKTPIVLLYGGSDSLVDIKVMLKELPKHTIAREVPHYEHLDFLWASDVDKLVFPPVIDALEFHASGKGRDGGAVLRSSSSQAPSTVQPPSYSEDERIPKVPAGPNGNDSREDTDHGGDTVKQQQTSSLPTSPGREAPQGRVVAVTSASPRQTPRSPINSQFTDTSAKSRPEGWWSSDDPGDRSESPSPGQWHAPQFGPRTIPTAEQGSTRSARHRAQTSSDSTRSSDANFSERGITLGGGKAHAVGGLVSRETAAQSLRSATGSLSSIDRDVARDKKKGRKR